jgi:hypothetical protein
MLLFLAFHSSFSFHFVNFIPNKNSIIILLTSVKYSSSKGVFPRHYAQKVAMFFLVATIFYSSFSNMTTDPYQYLEGFHNHHTSEALPDSLPKGMYAMIRI